MKKIYVGKSDVQGKGVFAGENIKKGQVICQIDGEKIRRELKSEKESKKFANWIGLGKNVWLNPNKTKFRYLNHSCNPTAAIVRSRTLIALHDLKKGEEITFDYSLTDIDPYWNMECRCNAPNCRKVIRPLYYLPANVFKEHFPNIPPFFQRVYIKNHINNGNKLANDLSLV